MKLAGPGVGRGFKDLLDIYKDWVSYLIFLGSQRHVTNKDLDSYLFIPSPDHRYLNIPFCLRVLSSGKSVFFVSLFSKCLCLMPADLIPNITD